MKTDTTILIRAMRILADEIQSEDGVANAAIAEAADRLEEYHSLLISHNVIKTYTPNTPNTSSFGE